MAIEWQEVLATGIDSIYVQHKEILDKFTAFKTACDDGSANEELIKLVEFLEKYSCAHSKYEEEALQEAEFPGLPIHIHQEQHKLLLNDIAELKRRVGENGPYMPEIQEMKRLLLRWLIQHIKQQDLAYVNFLKGIVANN